MVKVATELAIDFQISSENFFLFFTQRSFTESFQLLTRKKILAFSEKSEVQTLPIFQPKSKRNEKAEIYMIFP